MATVSKAEYARLCGVSRTAVSKCKNLHILPNGKINTEEPPNADYMALHMSGDNDRVILPRPESGNYKNIKAPPGELELPSKEIKNVSRETKRKTELKENDKLPRVRERSIIPKGDAIIAGAQDQEQNPALDSKREVAEILAKFLENLDVQKKKADIQLKRSQTMRHEVIIAEKKKELIPRDVVNQEIANFDAALKTNIRELARRISAQIYAVAVGQGAKAVEIELEAAISDAISRTKASLL